MSLTVNSYLELRQIEQELPVSDFYEVDRKCVMRYAIALATCGMSGDASLEKAVLEELIVEYAFRRAYCNWTNVAVKVGHQCIDYYSWRMNVKSVKEFNADE